jgi:hypothetical protein
VERLLDRIRVLGLRFWQVAREIAQQRSLTETSFIAVEDNPGGRRLWANVDGVVQQPRACNLLKRIKLTWPSLLLLFRHIGFDRRKNNRCRAQNSRGGTRTASRLLNS